MADFLASEWFIQHGYALWDMSCDYLRLAAEADLGIFDSGDPWDPRQEGDPWDPRQEGDPWQLPYGSGYTDIDYIRKEV